MYSYGPPHMAGQKQDDQHGHTFSSYVKIQGVALKTCWRLWTIGRSGERGSGISVPAAGHDDIYIYICVCVCVCVWLCVCARVRIISIYISLCVTLVAWGCPRGEMVKVMDCGVVESEFVFQSCYSVHFRANTLGKAMNPLILPAIG